MPDQAPKIAELSWGTVEVPGHGSFRDAKLWPGGARGWDWNETGTSHTPGIQIADVEELVQNDAQHVILSKGQNERLQVQEATLKWLHEQDVTVEVLETNQAVDRYNRLAREEEAVGALIHSTC